MKRQVARRPHLVAPSPHVFSFSSRVILSEREGSHKVQVHLRTFARSLGPSRTGVVCAARDD